jgi:hypothetical protein
MFVHIYELGVYFVVNLNESDEIPALEKRPVPYTGEEIFGDSPPPLITPAIESENCSELICTYRNVWK